MAITAALVKELRDMTSAGMMDAKKHWLKLTVISIKAVDLLREKVWLRQLKKLVVLQLKV